MLTPKMFAVVLLLCSVTALTYAVDMNHICLLLNQGALIASGDSCSSYYSCSNGVATLQNCPAGYYFNKNIQTCVSEAPSYCSTSNADPCEGHAVGSYVAVPESCSDYYYCSAKGALRNNCPSEFVFNPIKQSCDWPKNYPCNTSPNSNSAANSTGINICAYVKTNDFFGNAFSCSVWQKCTNDNNYITGTCPDGLKYDPKAMLCNYASAVDCSQVTYDESLYIPSAANDGACSKSGDVKNATACNQYYLCNGISWVLKNCPGNLYFDTKSGTCLNRMDAINNCDRCVGTYDEFVNTFGTNCMGYAYCSNGVQHSVGSCSPNYFNEEAQGCIPQKPDFKFCTADTAESSTTVSTTEGSTTQATGSTTEAPPTTTETPTTTTVKAS